MSMAATLPALEQSESQVHMTRILAVVFEQHNGWWIGTVEELPGAIAQECTLDEARASLVEAIQDILEVNAAYAA